MEEELEAVAKESKRLIDVARQNSWLAAVSMYVTEQIGVGLIASVVHELTQTLVHATHDV